MLIVEIDDCTLLESLAFQSLGVVYGDIGMPLLYVLTSTFPDGIDHMGDLLHDLDHAIH
jgi:K+ transporter